MLFGALGLALVLVGLLASAFAGRWAAAAALGVPGVGLRGVHALSGFGGASRARRTAVHVAGPFAAYFFPVLIFAVSFGIGGELVPTTAIEVLEGPAMEAGLRDGDQVTSIEDQRIDGWDALRHAVIPRPNLPTRVTVERAGKSSTFVVTPAVSPTGEGRISVKPVTEKRRLGFGAIVKRSLIEPALVVRALVTGIVRMIIGTEDVEVVGSVGVAREVGKTREQGWASTAYLLGMLGAYFWPATLLIEAAVVLGAVLELRRAAAR